MFSLTFFLLLFICSSFSHADSIITPCPDPVPIQGTTIVRTCSSSYDLVRNSSGCQVCVKKGYFTDKPCDAGGWYHKSSPCFDMPSFASSICPVNSISQPSCLDQAAPSTADCRWNFVKQPNGSWSPRSKVCKKASFAYHVYDQNGAMSAIYYRISFTQPEFDAAVTYAPAYNPLTYYKTPSFSPDDSAGDCDPTSKTYSFCIENNGQYQQEIIDHISGSLSSIDLNQSLRALNFGNAFGSLSSSNPVSFTDLDDADEQAIVDGINDKSDDLLSVSDADSSFIDAKTQSQLDQLSQSLNDADSIIDQPDKYNNSISVPDELNDISSSLSDLLPDTSNYQCSPFEISFPSLMSFNPKKIVFTCQASSRIKTVFSYILYFFTFLFVYFQITQVNNFKNSYSSSKKNKKKKNKVNPLHL